MRNIWQHVLGKPYLLYDDQKPSASEMTAGNDSSVPLSTPVTILKENYAECSSLEEKIAWAQSERGQSIIQSRPLLKHYYENGYLLKLFPNPLWEVRLKEWLAPLPSSNSNEKGPAPIPYGLTLPLTDEEIETNRRALLHKPHQNPPLQLLYEEYYHQYYYYTIPYENKFELYTKGYTVIQNIIPKTLIAAAVEAISKHIMDTDLYFDVLHNEKYAPKEYKEKDKKSSFSGFWNKKKKQEEEAEQQQKKGFEGKKFKEGTYADNPFFNPDKVKVRLESKKFQRDDDPHFVNGWTNDLSVLSLYYATPLHAMVESLLHGTPSQYSQKILQNTSEKLTVTSHPLKPLANLPTKDGSPIEEIRRPFRVAVGGAQVAYRFTQPIKRGKSRVDTLADVQKSNMIKAGESDKIKSSSLYDGMKSDDPLLNRLYPPIGGRSWHVDGLGRGMWGTFSFLIGIPLNDQFEEFAGNLCLHDGSHYTLKSYLKEYAHRFNAADTFDEKFRLANEVQKPDLGEPTQIIASAGDVVIALHKVAHLGGPNYSNEVRKMLYFRVSHERHHELRFAALDDLWIEYEGMQDIVAGNT